MQFVTLYLDINKSNKVLMMGKVYELLKHQTFLLKIIEIQKLFRYGYTVPEDECEAFAIL